MELNRRRYHLQSSTSKGHSHASEQEGGGGKEAVNRKNVGSTTRRSLKKKGGYDVDAFLRGVMYQTTLLKEGENPQRRSWERIHGRHQTNQFGTGGKLTPQPKRR